MITRSQQYTEKETATETHADAYTFSELQDRHIDDTTHACRHTHSKTTHSKPVTINKLDKTKKEELIKILELNNIQYPKKNTNKQLIELIISNNLIK